MKVEKLSAKIQSGSKFSQQARQKMRLFPFPQTTCEADQLFCEQIDIKTNTGALPMSMLVNLWMQNPVSMRPFEYMVTQPN